MREQITRKLTYDESDLSTLSEEAFSKICSEIASLDSITALTAVSLKQCGLHKLTTERQERLAEALFEGKVKKLNLADNKLSHMANLPTFFTCLFANTYLEKINLSNNALASHEKANSIFTSSLFGGRLLAINLKNNDLNALTPKTFSRFLMGFSVLKSIQVLNLANNNLTPLQKEEISKFIRSFPAFPLEIILHAQSKCSETGLFSAAHPPSPTTEDPTGAPLSLASHQTG